MKADVIIHHATTAFGPLLLSLASAVASRAGVLMGQLSQYENWQRAILRLDDVVGNVVRAVEHQQVATIKNVSPRGTLGANTKKLLHEATLARVKQQLGPAGLSDLLTALGVDPQSVDRFITTRIEATVYQLRLLQKRARATRRAPATMAHRTGRN